MTKNIQIATMRDSYDHIISADRKFSSDEIVIITIKYDMTKDSKYQKEITNGIKKVGEYTKLVNSKLHKEETIAVKDKSTFYEIISECVDIILKFYEKDDTILINLTEGSFLLNGALHYAGTIVKSFYNIGLSIIISEIIGNETVSFDQEQLLTSSIWEIISTKDKPLILDCIELGMNVEEMAVILDVSPGTISNWLHSLEENGLINISKRNRELTDIGMLVNKITGRERMFILISKYEKVVSKYLKNGLTVEEIAKKIGISKNMAEKWIKTKDAQNRFESVYKQIKGDLRREIVQKLLILKQE
jgi:transposase